VLELLQPFCDAIHQLEADEPLLSQVDMSLHELAAEAKLPFLFCVLCKKSQKLYGHAAVAAATAFLFSS